MTSIPMPSPQSSMSPESQVDQAQLSQRARNMQESPLRKLAGIAKQREAGGTKVYYLNIGQPDLPTPQEFFDALTHNLPKTVEYTMSQGMPEAVEAWRAFLQQSVGVELATKDVMVTVGGSEALMFAMGAVADHGDNILVFEPFYTNYNAFGTLMGVRMNPVPQDIETGFHLPSDEEIVARINPQTRALLICNPSNPTGTVYAREEMDRLMQIARDHNLYVIADEVYREFAFTQKAVSALEYNDMHDRVIVIDSSSKRFNACGARIGCLVTRNADVMQACLKFAMSRLAPATLEQHALVPVLQHAARIVPPVVNEYRARTQVVYDALSAMPGVVAHRPEGAFYTICSLPVESAEDFVRFMIETFEDNGETVLLAPAQGFYATPGKGRSEIRIAAVLETAALTRAMEILAKGLAAYHNA